MVLIEELEEDEIEVKAEADKERSDATETGNAPAVCSAADTASAEGQPAVKKGFLNDNKKSLYGPEGSQEGKVAPETHKAHMEHDLSKKLNANANPMTEAHGDLPQPDWYTSEWPKGCQYNSPGCVLAPMETSKHQTPLHQEMVTKHERWQEALGGGQKRIRLSFLQLKDEDVATLMASLKGNDVVEEIDLSHNEIMDAGIQTMVGAFANGAAPNLKELRVYENKWGDLGKVMLESGLRVLRKKLVVHAEKPSFKTFGGPPPPPAAETTGGA